MKQRINPSLYKADQCFRYVPRHNYETFVQQIELTNGELLNLLPPGLYEMSKNFQSTKRNLAITFWAANIGFVTFCHRIGFMRRIFSNSWAMFAFKASVLCGSYFMYGELERRAIQEHFRRVYKYIQDDYRKYKNTGDIREFNPAVKVFQIQWPDVVEEPATSQKAEPTKNNE